MNLLTLSKNPRRLASSLTLVAIVLLASWMGYRSGGYFLRDWAPVLFALAGITLVAALTGTFYGTGSRWGTAALALFAGYAAWTAASLLWSPSRGDAWLGASQTFLYLIAFGLALGLLALGASRRWVLTASVLGPAVVGAFTLLALVPDLGDLFKDNRLIGTLGYYNGEAAFLLIPFWVAIYLAGSWRTNWVARGLILAGATLTVELATLTQSRGALVAMAVSLPIFFAFSGQRLRGLLALVPVAAALVVSFPDLNGVYLAFLKGGEPVAALGDAVPLVWWTSAAVGLYGLLWGLVDRVWSPPAGLVRASGATVLVVLVVASIIGAVVWSDRVGDPVSWTAGRWEAFRSDRATGQEHSRYLGASGTGRYTLWQVAWRDFMTNPLLGVGTQNYEATYYQLREKWIEWAKYARQPHSLPLEILGERGAIGGMLFFGFLGVCLTAGLRQRFKYLNAEGKALVGATVAAVSYWFVHSAVEWFWQLPAVTLPVVVYLAVLVAPWHRAETEPQGWPLRAGIALGAVLMIAAVAPLYIADRYLARSYATANPRVALDFVESAQRFNPVNPQLAQREAELAIQLRDWPRAEKAYGKATRLNPEHYAPYVLLARYYEQVGEPEKALSSYRKALALNPLDKELNREVTRLRVKAEAS